MLVINETNILLAVIGSVGVIASLIVYLYGSNRSTKFERQLSKKAVIDSEVDNTYYEEGFNIN